MKLLDRIIRSYSYTANYPKIFKTLRFDSVVRHFLVVLVNLFSYFFLIRSLNSNPKMCNNSKVNKKIIVSLTSFPPRINSVWKAIASLLNQTLKPDKIILWLSIEQFPNKSCLPLKLRKMEKYGLEIRIVENNYKSHKKYLYVFEEFKNDFVMLADDDILYPSDTISTLIKNIQEKTVHCSYGSKIMYLKNGRLSPYNQWKSIIQTYDGEDLFFGTGGGTLLCPGDFPAETLNIENAYKLCPSADDVWLNAMARLGKLKIKKVRKGLIFPINNKKDDTLCAINVGESQNDIQLKNVEDYYNITF